MRRKTICSWLCFFCLLAVSSVAKAQTYTLFDNGLSPTVTDFTTNNPSQVTPWAYRSFNASTSVYSSFSGYRTNGKFGALGSWSYNTTEWFYIGSTGEIHMKDINERPAVCFIAPSDGYYKADVQVTRKSYGNWASGKAQVWAYFNFVTGTSVAPMGFDLEVATDALNTAGTYYTPKTQTIYSYLKQGDVITFEVGVSTANTGNGNTTWDLIQVSLTDENTAKGEGNNFYNYYGIATAEQLQALSELIAPAKEMQAYMLSYGIASNSTDYGKFNETYYNKLSSDITQAEELVAQLGESEITATPAQVSVLMNDLSSDKLLDYKNQYYRFAIKTWQGWYRVKTKIDGTYSYLNNTMKFEDGELKNDGSQYFYFTRYNNVDTRFRLFSYTNLQTGNIANLGCDGGGSANFFELFSCGAEGLFMSSGGGSPQRWAGLNADNTIKKENSSAPYLDRLLFFELEPLQLNEYSVALVPDGDYTLSVNGSAVGSSEGYSVQSGKITVNGNDYSLNSYGDMAYSIGDSLATLAVDLSRMSTIGSSQPNPAPFPSFRLTPIVEGDEAIVSTLTNFDAEALIGKTVQVSGTVDFENLDAAKPETVKLIDNEPFFAYRSATLANTSVSYTRSFNDEASDVYSTATAPKWETICLPFDVETVEGECPVVYSGGTNAWNGSPRALAASEDYWLYELTNGGFVRNTTGIEANKPYIIAFPYAWVEGDASQSYAPKLNVSGAVTFTGTAVAATNEEKSEGEEFNMVANFKNVAAGDEVYVLDADGVYFEKGTADANPFRPYVIVPAGDGATPNRIYINNEEPTGLDKVSSVADNSVKIISVPGGASITSEEAHAVTICTMGGAVLGRVNVQAGTQTITLPVGAFIVDGVKIIVTE